MFQEGDRVRLKNDQDDHGEGLCGTIGIGGEYGMYIKFDTHQDFAHNAEGQTEDGFGWWVDEENLELQFDVKEFISDQTGDTEEDI